MQGLTARWQQRNCLLTPIAKTASVIWSKHIPCDTHCSPTFVQYHQPQVSSIDSTILEMFGGGSSIVREDVQELERSSHLQNRSILQSPSLVRTNQKSFFFLFAGWMGTKDVDIFSLPIELLQFNLFTIHSVCSRQSQTCRVFHSFAMFSSYRLRIPSIPTQIRTRSFRYFFLHFASSNSKPTNEIHGDEEEDVFLLLFVHLVLEFVEEVYSRCGVSSAFCVAPGAPISARSRGTALLLWQRCFSCDSICSRLEWGGCICIAASCPHIGHFVAQSQLLFKIRMMDVEMFFQFQN